MVSDSEILKYILRGNLYEFCELYELSSALNREEEMKETKRERKRGV